MKRGTEGRKEAGPGRLKMHQHRVCRCPQGRAREEGMGQPWLSGSTEDLWICPASHPRERLQRQGLKIYISVSFCASLCGHISHLSVIFRKLVQCVLLGHEHQGMEHKSCNKTWNP